MIRGAVVLLLIVTLVAIAALAPWWTGSRPGERSPPQPDEVCHPLEDACRWRTPAGPATLALAAAEDNELLLELTLPGTGADARPMVILTGESMYMGEYPLGLTPGAEPGQYRVRFVPPFCSTGADMTWRISLRTHGEPVALPFRALFSPSGRG